jgi:hypothetical protein
MEATKKAGQIIDYKVFTARPKSADQPNREKLRMAEPVPPA